MSYEKEQGEFWKLWNDVLFDESDFSPDVFDYEPSDSGSDSDEPVAPKKFWRAVQTKNMVITSLQPHQTFEAVQIEPNDSNMNENDIERVIEEVITQNTVLLESDSNENLSNYEVLGRVDWGPVTGNNMKHFIFPENNPGILDFLYDDYQKRNPTTFISM